MKYIVSGNVMIKGCDVINKLFLCMPLQAAITVWPRQEADAEHVAITDIYFSLSVLLTHSLLCIY